jgi:hypothetical protein
MKMLKISSTLGAASIALCGALHAQVYWDINGTSAGATDTGDASGTWDIATTANWNPLADGTDAVTTYTDGDSVVFSAGTNTVTGTITVSGTPTTSSLTIEEGAYTFDGDLELGTAATYTVATGASATFTGVVKTNDNSSFVIDGTSTMNLNGYGKEITKTGSGTLTLVDSYNSDYRVVANEGLTVLARTTTKRLKSVTIGANGTLQLTTSEQLGNLTTNGIFIMDANLTDTIGELKGSGSFQAGDNTSLEITKGGSFSGDITGDLDLTINATNGFTLSDGSSVEFVIAGDGVNNSITGTSVLALDGLFEFDLTDADLTEGNSWLIVDVASLDETFGATFGIVDFTESDGIWTYDSNALLQFSEAAGYLSMVPEPSSYALLAGCFGLALVMFKRRK